MEPEMIVETTEERMKLIKECISYKDPIGVKKLILEDKFNVESEHWELVSILGDCITEENFKNCPSFVSVCERCMNYILKVGNPKELLLALLEQADGFNDSTKFSTYLSAIEKTILKIESNQTYSLELALETLSDCVRKLELPKNLDLEGEERRAQDLDPFVGKINLNVQAYLNFLSVFVKRIDETKTKESGGVQKEKKILVKYLLKILEHPLVFLDLQAKEVNGHIVKSSAVKCVECLMGQLTVLWPRISDLIEDCLKNNERLRRRKKRKVDENEEMFCASFDEPVSVLALSCLSYLMYVEGYGQHVLPCLFTKQGVMESNLPFVLTLMKKDESEVRLKGVQLLQTFLHSLDEDTVLSYEDLDRPEYFRILDNLFDIMIRCPVRDIREQCVKMVPGFIQLFCFEARYQIWLKLFGTLKHAGAFGYCVQLFKNQMEEIMTDSVTGSKTARIFCGMNLKRIFLLMTSLPEGPATDLVECSDRVIAVLNFMRFIILKDPPQTNLTGFWDFFGHIEKEFLQALQLGLDMSKGHYKLEISGLEDGNVSNESSKEQVEMSISVAGFRLPKMARGQKIAIMNQALNTLDLITSLLVRVNELVEQQKKAENK